MRPLTDSESQQLGWLSKPQAERIAYAHTQYAKSVAQEAARWDAYTSEQREEKRGSHEWNLAQYERVRALRLKLEAERP